MMIELQSGDFQAVINPLGAELISLKNKHSDLEYIWQADASLWGKHSPVLFPIVGSLKNNTFLFEGKSYELPRHGFAREKMFFAERINQNKAVFTLKSNEETLSRYPFPFQLQLKYALNENSLQCTYVVYNPGKDTLWFSVGAHPAFKVPLSKSAKYEDYYLQFNQPEKLIRWHLQDGLISEQHSEVPATSGRVPLHPSLFYEDALVLKNIASTKITLANTKDPHGFDFLFEGFPYFGIWAAKDAPFVCLEPWCGHADTVDHNQELTLKPGIEMLEGGGNWERSWKVEVF